MAVLKSRKGILWSDKNYCVNKSGCLGCSEFGDCEIRKNNHNYDKYAHKIVVVKNIISDLNLDDELECLTAIRQIQTIVEGF